MFCRHIPKPSRPSESGVVRSGSSMMASQNVKPPVLSLVERDRRWANVRGLMRERSFEGLLVAGFRSREMYETYISDDYNEGCVIFPLEGDPVVITWA